MSLSFADLSVRVKVLTAVAVAAAWSRLVVGIIGLVSLSRPAIPPS